MFPNDFLWGASSSSAQIEGGYDRDGRGDMYKRQVVSTDKSHHLKSCQINSYRCVDMITHYMC